MSDVFHRLADVEAGDADRRECRADLDAILLSPDPARIAAFLERWGEPLRDLLMNFDDAVEDAASQRINLP